MYFFFVLLLWIDLVFSSHFNGGTITWQPLDSSDTTSPVAIAITQTYSWVYTVVPCNQTAIATQTPINTVYNNNDVVKCVTSCSSGYGYTSVPIARYCTNFSPILGITNTQRTDIVQLSANASLSIAFTPASLAYWRPLKAVSAATTTTATWSITSTINLNKRSDTGRINTAPIGNVISPIEIPLNTPQQITIPVIDADNDILKCRWARKTPVDECMDVCPPACLPAGVSLSTNCTLYITGTLNNSWYVAAIMVEDFSDASSTTPLSSVPVQFLIHVVQPASCSVLPRLTGLNVTNMACVGVQTTVQYTSILYIDNYCGPSVTIVALSVQSFPGMVTGPLTTINSSLYSMNLTWTPVPSQIGLQMLCAIAQDSQNQQSLQFCLVFSVAIGGTGGCPGAPAETTVVTTAIADTSMITTTASTTTEQTATMVALITSMEISTIVDTTTDMIAETTENITSISSIPSMMQLTFTTTRNGIPKSTINLPLIIGISLLALLLALLCCFCYLYYLFWGIGSRRRRREQTKGGTNPAQQKEFLLADAGSTASSVPKQFFTTKSSISQSLRSSGIARTFDPPVNFISDDKTTTDIHVTVSRSNRAVMPAKQINKNISTTDASPKIISRRNSVGVVRVQRVSTADKDNKSLQPINGVLTQPETDASYSRITKIGIAKEPKAKSAVPLDARIINVTSKDNVTNNSSTIVKTDANNQQKRRMKKTKSVSVVRLSRIKTSVRPNTETESKR